MIKAGAIEGNPSLTVRADIGGDRWILTVEDEAGGEVAKVEALDNTCCGDSDCKGILAGLAIHTNERITLHMRGDSSQFDTGLQFGRYNMCLTTLCVCYGDEACADGLMRVDVNRSQITVCDCKSRGCYFDFCISRWKYDD